MTPERKKYVLNRIHIIFNCNRPVAICTTRGKALALRSKLEKADDNLIAEYTMASYYTNEPISLPDY